MFICYCSETISQMFTTEVLFYYHSIQYCQQAVFVMKILSSLFTSSSNSLIYVATVLSWTSTHSGIGKKNHLKNAIRLTQSQKFDSKKMSLRNHGLIETYWKGERVAWWCKAHPTILLCTWYSFVILQCSETTYLHRIRLGLCLHPIKNLVNISP